MGEWAVYIHVFLTSTIVEGKWLALRSYLFTSGDRVPCTHFMGIPVDPRPGLVDMEK
jgi:hypothetical protein